MLVVSVLPAFWFTKFFIRDSYQLHRAQSWPEVAAVVRLSADNMLPEHEDKGHGPSALYERIEYTFTVEGREYISRRVTPFQSWNSGKHTGRFKEGATVSAWVNPQNPYESVLDRNKHFGFYAVLSLMILFDAWLAFALLTVFLNQRYVTAFSGQIMVIIPACIVIGAVVANDVERTTDWWLVIGGFMGTIASVGIAIVLSTCNRKLTFVGATGVLAGIVCLIAGVMLKK